MLALTLVTANATTKPRIRPAKPCQQPRRVNAAATSERVQAVQSSTAALPADEQKRGLVCKAGRGRP